MHGALHRLHRDHFRAGLDKAARRRVADVAEALDAHARAFEGQADLGRRGASADEHAAPGRIAPPAAAAQGKRLAGHHRSRGRAVHHRIGVHHPRHDLFVGVDVGRGNVLVRADDDADLAGVASRQAFEFGFGQRRGSTRTPPLAPPKGTPMTAFLMLIQPARRHHFRQRYVLMETHAALARAARSIVLHAIALEVRDRAVIELDRHIDDEDALRALQRFDEVGKLAQRRSRTIDLLQEHAPGTDARRLQVGRQCMRWVHVIRPQTRCRLQWNAAGLRNAVSGFRRFQRDLPAQLTVARVAVFAEQRIRTVRNHRQHFLPVLRGQRLRRARHDIAVFAARGGDGSTPDRSRPQPPPWRARP